MTTLAARLAENTPRELPIDPKLVGVGVFTLLVILLLVTLTFGRNR
jgi:type II secretory pathway component PulM